MLPVYLLPMFMLNLFDAWSKFYVAIHIPFPS